MLAPSLGHSASQIVPIYFSCILISGIIDTNEQQPGARQYQYINTSFKLRLPVPVPMFHTPEIEILKTHIISQARLRFHGHFGDLDPVYDIVFEQPLIPTSIYSPPAHGDTFRAHLVVYYWWETPPGYYCRNLRIKEFQAHEVVDRLNDLHLELMRW
jgi:hypothetical protein